MKPLSSLIPATVQVLSFVVACLIASSVNAQNNAYFMISEPAPGRQWANGAANPLQWSKGLFDGVRSFDIEMARMNKDGILYLARDVPASVSSLNVFLTDVPTGNDYYMLFINSTHGVMYSITPQFSVVDSASGNNLASPIASAPTITLSGAPNPTAAFVTTYPPTNDGIPLRWIGMGGWMSCLVTIVCGMTVGAFMVFV